MLKQSISGSAKYFPKSAPKISNVSWSETFISSPPFTWFSQTDGKEVTCLKGRPPTPPLSPLKLSRKERQGRTHPDSFWSSSSSLSSSSSSSSSSLSTTTIPFPAQRVKACATKITSPTPWKWSPALLYQYYSVIMKRTRMIWWFDYFDAGSLDLGWRHQSPQLRLSNASAVL